MHKKHKKGQNANKPFTHMFFTPIKSTKKYKTQTSNFHSDVFTRTKSTKRKQATFNFFLLDVFVAHKNAVLFVFVCLDNFKLFCFLRENFTHKKAEKHI